MAGSFRSRLNHPGRFRRLSYGELTDANEITPLVAGSAVKLLVCAFADCRGQHCRGGSVDRSGLHRNRPLAGPVAAPVWGRGGRRARDNVAILLRMLGAFQTLAGLTASPARRRALGEQVNWIADLVEHAVEAAHDRATIDRRLAGMREALAAGPALRAGGEKVD